MNAATLAAWAATAIEKATQDENNSWVKSFRKKANENPPGLRISLHASLLNAADSFHGDEPDLSKRLREICSLLDGMPPE